MDVLTVPEVIERLGGVATAARRLKVSRASVYDWIKAGYLPAARVLQIHSEEAIPLNRLPSVTPEQRSAA